MRPNLTQFFGLNWVGHRDANSPAIFIPRGFEELGNGNLLFLRDWGKQNLFPGLQVRGSGEFRGVFCFRFEVNLKFLFLEKRFFLTQRNNMIFMIRNDKIAGN